MKLPSSLQGVVDGLFSGRRRPRHDKCHQRERASAETQEAKIKATEEKRARRAAKRLAGAERAETL